MDASGARRRRSPASRAPARLIAVGGGRGGVGKSLVAANLAVYFAQLGKTVVLVDADADRREPPRALRARAPRAGAVARRARPTSSRRRSSRRACRGSRSCPRPHDADRAAAPLRAGRKSALARARSARCPPTTSSSTSGPGTAHLALDVMLAADIADLRHRARAARRSRRPTASSAPRTGDASAARSSRDRFRLHARRARARGDRPPARAARARSRAREDGSHARRARVGRGARACASTSS